MQGIPKKTRNLLEQLETEFCGIYKYFTSIVN